MLSQILQQWGESMVDLRIDQQFGQIGLKYTPFQYTLDIRQADLNTKQSAAEIFLEQPAATLEIDYTPARESLGYLGISSQTNSFVADAKATQLTGVERRVAEGRAMSSIEKGISIGEIAAQALESQEKVLGLDLTSPVRIEIQANRPRWVVQLGGVNSSFTAGDVQGDFTFGKVQTYLEQESFVHVYSTGSVMDLFG